ncbi:hypothetical protein D3C80_1954350 [compost metagenome]
MLHRQLAHFACAEDQHSFAGKHAEDTFAQLDSRIADRNCALPDGGLAVRAFAESHGLFEQLVKPGSGHTFTLRSQKRIAHLAQNLRLANYH